MVGQDGRVEAGRTEISKEAEDVLKGNGKHAPTPMDQSADRKKSIATTNSLEKWFTIIAPRYDRGNEAEDGAEDSLDVDDRKDPSVMGPPGLPASAIRNEEKKENSKISFSMGTPGLRNSAKRGKRRRETAKILHPWVYPNHQRVRHEVKRRRTIGRAVHPWVRLDCQRVRQEAMKKRPWAKGLVRCLLVKERGTGQWMICQWSGIRRMDGEFGSVEFVL